MRAGAAPAEPRPSISQARQAPASASRNVSSGAPPIAAQRAVGASAWLIASLPQGNAYGHRSRTASAATHQPATATGHARSRSSRHWPTASTAKLTVWAAARAAHTYQATLTSQEVSGTKKAAPNTSPATRLARRLLRHNATASRACRRPPAARRPRAGRRRPGQGLLPALRAAPSAAARHHVPARAASRLHGPPQPPGPRR